MGLYLKNPAAPDAIFICEVKAQNELDDPEVKTKASAAVKWCKAATDHAIKNGGKPWSYALISDEYIFRMPHCKG